MQQQVTNTPAQLFKHALASPATLTQEHTDSLQTLLSSFPQSGVLHALLARTGLTVDVNRAAAWFSNSAVLRKIVQAPHTLPAVNPAQVIIQKFKVSAPPAEAEQAIMLDEETEPVSDSYYHLRNNDTTEADTDEEIPEPIAGGKNFARFRQEQLNDDTEKLILENLASNDYFVFDRAFTGGEKIEEAQPEPEANEEYVAPRSQAPQQAAPTPEPQPAAPEEGTGVTRYHDDKMPYSFMWWLDKTRNKHSGVYQPFANPAVQQRNPPPVYYQPEPIPIQEEPKKEEILDRFIEEAPQQIKPPTSDKLTGGNKAKQSADDQEELITETLARIYADQMLFSKAIAAYKILMLKNPEKRRYFADQIEVLEKKIN